MRVAFLMEVVMAMAVGVALACEAEPLNPYFSPYSFQVSGLGRAIDVIKREHAAASGIALVIGLGTWVEAARRKAPGPWGPGRWVWSITAACFLIRHVVLVADYGLRCLDRQTTRQPGIYFLIDLYAVRHERSREVAVMIAALWITSRIARPPLGSIIDARERTGRWFAGFVLSTLVLDTLLIVYSEQIFG